MKKFCKLAKLMAVGWLVLGIMWLVPPAKNNFLRLCPVRPDGVSEAEAMPMWARRYGMSCAVCHTTVPSLTPAGYAFRRAGFRMPDEIGEDAKMNGLQDLYSVRIREEFRFNEAAGDISKTPTDHSNGFAFHELTFYPISGAFGKYWGSESELTFSPGSEVEVENAYVRATIPYSKDLFFHARAGIFHPFEGYGASDRPISNIRPTFQTSTAKKGAFDTGTKLWNQDQEGLELGGTYKDSSLTVAIVNGFNTTSKSAIEPGGGSGKNDDDNNDRDILLSFNQIIGDRAGVTAQWWTGYTSSDTWSNHFSKLALYANYKVLGDKLDFLSGLAKTSDQYNAAGDSFESAGWFLEARSKLHEHFTAGLRYDTNRRDLSTGDNRVGAVTVTGVIPFDEIKFLLDYQRKQSEQTGTGDKIDHIGRAEWMVIF